MSYLKLYNHFDLEIDRAKGVYIFAKNGEKYLDTFSGIGVLSFGHAHYEINQCFIEKLQRYSHLSNFFLDEDVDYVSEKLIDFTSKSGKVFYANSGTEANEAVLKTIRKISTSEKHQVIYFDKGFHGRTTGSLSVTGFSGIKDCFSPLLQHTIKLPFNDPQTLEDYFVENHQKIAAIFVEAVQGSGGVVPLTEEFANTINRLHKKYNFTLVCDEIQAGLGRTGKYFAYQHFGLNPNLVSVAKSLGGGLPLGAVLFLEEHAKILKPGDHGSTFAPNPVALAGARYIVDNIPDILSEINEKGHYFIKKIAELNNDKIKALRGKGLMLAIELKNEDETLRQRAFGNHLLLNVLQNKTIRLLPALNITYDEIDETVEKIGELL